MKDFDVNDAGELKRARDTIATLREHLASSRAVAARALEEVRRLDAVACAAHRDAGKSEETRAALRSLLNRGYVLQDAATDPDATEHPFGQPFAMDAGRKLEAAGYTPSDDPAANRIRLSVMQRGPSVRVFAEALAAELATLREHWVEELRALDADPVRRLIATLRARGAEALEGGVHGEAFAQYMDPRRADRETLGDLVELADGLADLVYVAAGLALVVGIPLEPVFEAVHAANMRKGPGPFREDGKKLKPEGWVGPEGQIRAILAERFPALAAEAERSVLGVDPGIGESQSAITATYGGTTYPVDVHEHDPERQGCGGCPMLSMGFDGPGCSALGMRLHETDSRSGDPVPPDACPLRSGAVLVQKGRSRG